MEIIKINFNQFLFNRFLKLIKRDLLKVSGYKIKRFKEKAQSIMA